MWSLPCHSQKYWGTALLPLPGHAWLSSYALVMRKGYSALPLKPWACAAWAPRRRSRRAGANLLRARSTPRYCRQHHAHTAEPGEEALHRGMSCTERGNAPRYGTRSLRCRRRCAVASRRACSAGSISGVSGCPAPSRAGPPWVPLPCPAAEPLSTTSVAVDGMRSGAGAVTDAGAGAASRAGT